MSSTLTKRTRHLRAELDSAAKSRAAMLDAIDEWAEATYRHDELPTGDVRKLAAVDRVRDAEQQLLAIHGREQAW